MSGAIPSLRTTVMSGAWLAAAASMPTATAATERHPAPVVGSQYVTGAAPAAAASGRPVIRVYRDSVAWNGEGRDSATLAALGKVLGEDWFIHPISDCGTGIPADTDVVLFTSNAAGLESAALAQSSAACTGALTAFLDRGGRLVVDLGDNVINGGFTAPGAVGTPDYLFPNPPAPAELTPESAGADGVFGTADDHPLLFGPDRLPGTADDLTSDNIDLVSGGSVAHGNLAEGFTLPPDATRQITATFASGIQPIHAEYCIGVGRVIVDTVTKEFSGHPPRGSGPSNYLLALLGYALSDDAACTVKTLEVPVDIKPSTCANTLNTRLGGSFPVVVAGRPGLDLSAIDLSTVTLNGVPAIRSSTGDLSTPGDCAGRRDGVRDLVFRFDNRAIAATVAGTADGALVPLNLSGKLKAEAGATPIAGADAVRVIRRR